MVMDYFPLGNLADQGKVTSISHDESLQLCHQLLLAVEYLHSLSITHRDIKPENILVESRQPFHVRLADFGFANDTPGMNSFCGTEGYAAPEIYDKNIQYTAAVDIWSTGVVVFEYAYHLPSRSKRDSGVIWADKIIRELRNVESEPLVNILAESMLRKEPPRRSSARECLRKMKDLVPIDTLDPASPRSTILRGDSSQDLMVESTYLRADIGGGSVRSEHPTDPVERAPKRLRATQQLEEVTVDEDQPTSETLAEEVRKAISWQRQRYQQCTINGRTIRMTVLDKWISFYPLVRAAGPGSTFDRLF